MQNQIVRKPEWLRKKITPVSHADMEHMLDKEGVRTVCQEAMCPNISECFKQKQATFLILGTICTRACSFCAVSKGAPLKNIIDEPKNVARAVESFGLRHVVITSPTRDDLEDGGARVFCETVEAIKSMDSTITVELLIPDMRGDEKALRMVAGSSAEIVGHNLETVPRLYHVRSGANYERSLGVLKMLSLLNPSLSLKSGIMLGLGESDEEVITLMRNLLSKGCRYLSIGQYLSPSNRHTQVVEFVKPERFEHLRKMGMDMGFKHIKSSPYTRSSYMAQEYLEKK